MGIKFVTEHYFVSESFYSLQGEGAFSGRAAYFVRLAGCRVGCPWCDSKESWKRENGREMSVAEILKMVADSGTKIVVITGGEPMLHNLDTLTSALKESGVRVHLETSGSEPFSGTFDWITLSPKRLKECREEYFGLASELKVVVESNEDFIRAQKMGKKVNKNCLLLLQSEWSVREEMMPKIIEFIKKNNNWGLSLQTHKFIGVE
ncbi:MAG: 7-carboxy-7-deazaguanine synthase QueE [Rikenellaceae bacterium]